MTTSPFSSLIILIMHFARSGDWLPPTTVKPADLHAPLPSGHLYENLVPPPTRLTPGELLDRYYNDRRNIFEWTGSKGLLRNQSEVFLNYPGNVGAPIGSSGLIGKWERPGGLLAVPVPVRGVDSVHDRSRVVRIIEFRDPHHRGPSRGPHVATLCGNGANPAGLRGAEDIVLDNLRGSEINFVISWPGYKAERFPIRIVSQNGGPMTRFDLGGQLSIAYAMFFRKVEKEILLPSAAGFYNIALHQGKNQRSDSLGIQFMQLHLVRLRNAVGGGWVADVEIV